MTIGIRDDKRRVIPRWRETVLTARTGEMAPLRESVTPPKPDLTEFELAIREWNLNQNLGNAFEVMAGGLVLDRSEDAKEAAEYVLASQESSLMSRGLAKKILDTTDKTPIPIPDDLGFVTVSEERARIAAAKRLLIDYPTNPLLWADLSRNYVLIGQLQPALWAMKRALAIAPNHRVVLRAATRLFIHAKDPEQALDRLLRSPATLRDPWLMAAQLATSEVAEKAPTHQRRAVELLHSGSFSPLQLSELASALGTLEIGAGNPKLGRRLVKESLAIPTENAVAQAIWLSRKIKDIKVQTDLGAVERSYEARARFAYLQANWKDSAFACQQWCMDEPFSSRPSLLGSFLACAILENPELSERFADRGLQANPSHPILLNNKAVALADSGRVLEGWKIFKSIHCPPNDLFCQATLNATKGLFYFRFGQPKEGRVYYRKAIESNERNQQFKALALAHLAKEEFRLDPVEGVALLPELESASKDISDPALQAIVERLKNRPKEPAANSPEKF